MTGIEIPITPIIDHVKLAYQTLIHYTLLPLFSPCYWISNKESYTHLLHSANYQIRSTSKTSDAQTKQFSILHIEPDEIKRDRQHQMRYTAPRSRTQTPHGIAPDQNTRGQGMTLAAKHITTFPRIGL
jgi:hypothetical protein